MTTYGDANTNSQDHSMIVDVFVAGSDPTRVYEQLLDYAESLPKAERVKALCRLFAQASHFFYLLGDAAVCQGLDIPEAISESFTRWKFNEIIENIE